MLSPRKTSRRSDQATTWTLPERVPGPAGESYPTSVSGYAGCGRRGDRLGPRPVSRQATARRGRFGNRARSTPRQCTVGRADSRRHAQCADSVRHDLLVALTLAARPTFNGSEDLSLTVGGQRAIRCRTISSARSGSSGLNAGLTKPPKIDHHQRMFAWASEVKGQPITRFDVPQHRPLPVSQPIGRTSTPSIRRYVMRLEVPSGK